MALSLSNFLVCLIALLPKGLPSAIAATVTHDFNVGWVRGNPDGMAERSVIGINGQWPLPLLNFTKGDRVIINLHNKLGNQSTSAHFHGLYQNGTNDMDGPVGVTQCDVPPGHSMTYNFTVDQPGTYWYHSHTRGQYPDGWRGQFIIHDPENPFRGQFDEEMAFTVSDWYHDEMPGLLTDFISHKNPTGAEPVPNSALMNDTQNFTVAVEPGKTYFFRLTNIGAFAGQYFWIEGHRMRIIEVDGVYTQPAETDMIYLTTAQRYGFLVTMKENSSSNFAMVSSMDESLFDVVPPTLNPNVTGWLMYDASAPKPVASPIEAFHPFDDFSLVPEDGLELFDHVDYSFNLDLKMDNLGDGANYAFFNDVTYVTPVVPTLYSVLTTGDKASEAAVYGAYTNSYVLNKGDIVEIVLNNDDGGKHPFHLHGHNFQTVYRAPAGSGFYNASDDHSFPAAPMRRDTLMVNPNGNFAIRFRADNPGESAPSAQNPSALLMNEQESGSSTATSTGTWPLALLQP
ncbi:uncharacterized protein LTR77_009660 [Saxophila tyrrhenica]|uniref:Laccase n=1 Tax=Saxophila tyrrhenica TaxID=1690608 RepID=A0AAV9NX04_9PEZI|nr:hypothetical protein LTR77_009660 [Saxophila tyrrhenica]